jgi:hypothetical protein
MEVSKIHLSSAEIELMQNADIILTKNRVLEKIRSLLESVQQHQINYIQEFNVKNEIFKVSPKISRGENYLGLPYLILDYPRQSSGKNFFFIRTMFWWGNFFSCTLHLANNSKEIFKEKIKQSQPVLGDYYISVNDDAWVHHLKESDYKKINLLSKEQYEQCCESFDHIKIAGRHSLDEWEKMPSQLFENWKLLLGVCELIT